MLESNIKELISCNFQNPVKVLNSEWYILCNFILNAQIGVYHTDSIGIILKMFTTVKCPLSNSFN